MKAMGAPLLISGMVLVPGENDASASTDGNRVAGRLPGAQVLKRLAGTKKRFDPR